MMDGRLRELELRQRALVLRSELQRRAIAGEGADIAARLGGVESRVSLARQLVSLPALGIGATVLLLVAGPARALRVASRVLVGLTLARRALALVGSFAAGRGPGVGDSRAPFSRRD
jgi:hypothetical protein